MTGWRAAGMELRVPDALGLGLDRELGAWRREDRVGRIWQRDAGVWTGTDEGKWLGWLDIVPSQFQSLDRLGALADSIAADGFEDVVVLGMGGSSLCPEVLSLTWDRVPGRPRLRVLDSTDPAQVRRMRAQTDPARTLFIVSSKSGSTLEPNIFMEYFLHEVRSAVGPTDLGKHFIAITDPGSSLEAGATERRFRAICAGVPSIGGRYSALSDFGMVPAAIMGLDLRRLLERAGSMIAACGASTPAAENPGLVLGLLLGVAARAGRDKVTFVSSPTLWDLGAWLEQLLAESTGKHGRGLIPSDGELLDAPDRYGADRLFVELALEAESDAARSAALERLAAAGHPVARLQLRDEYDLGREFFRWEFATAVAGAVLGINPFDQPDVEASKVATRELTDEYERRGSLPAESAFAGDRRLRLYADPAAAERLCTIAGREPSVRDILRAHLAGLGEGRYLAMLAYLEMSEAHRQALQTARHAVRNRWRAATCVGFGPRFLHSTGQAYKGGPATGVFLQITRDPEEDLQVPGRAYSFGTVQAAQARGDFQVLVERGRPALRVHLLGDPTAALTDLVGLIVDIAGEDSPDP